MNRLIFTVCAVGLALPLFLFPSWAANSLISPDAIQQMKAAGISAEVIQTLSTEQTCSVSPAFLIALKQAGADDETLKQLVLADRYEAPEPFARSDKQVRLLRDIGCPEEVIDRLLEIFPPKPVIVEDEAGRVIYRTDTLSGSTSRDCVEPRGAFYINLEKVEAN